MTAPAFEARRISVGIGQLARVLTEMEQENSLTLELTPTAAIEQAILGLPPSAQDDGGSDNNGRRRPQN